MTARLAMAAWLVIVWVALWGDLSVANVVSGAAVAAALLIVFPLAGRAGARQHVRPLAVLRLAGHLVRKLLESNLTITRTVLSRRDRVRTGVIAVPMVCDSDGLLTMVANLTALSPGLMVIEIERDPTVCYVHVLQLDDVEAARAEVRTLERLVIEAFGPPAAMAAVRRRHAAEVTREGRAS